MLCSLNEHAVGFAYNNTPKNTARGSRLVLTAKGGVYSDGGGNITDGWKWDREAQNKGRQPQGGVNMPLK